MVHLESVLGTEATEIVLRGMSDLADLPIAVFVLDPTDRSRLHDYIRPKSATGEPYKFTKLCDYLHKLKGGEELCKACDLSWGWRILDERWTQAQRYECHMGLSEFGITVEAGGDLVDPIVWGQARLAGSSIEQHIDTLRDRAEGVVPGAGAKIGDEHLDELRKLANRVRVIEQAKADDLCERLTSGARGLQHLLRTEYHIARTLHRIKSSLSLSRGAADRLIPLIFTTGEFGDLYPPAVKSAMRERCRRIEEGVEGAALAIDEFERSKHMSAEEGRRLSPRWHPLRELTERGARRIRAEAEGRHIEVRGHGPTGGAPKDCYVYVDWDSMLEVLDLLLDNALKYSWSGREGESRRIDVSWHIRPHVPDGLPAGQGPTTDGDWLEIDIESFGLQIHPGDRDTIFIPGGRGRLTDPRRSILGAGMGLSIALEIVLQHDGYINVWCRLFENPSAPAEQLGEEGSTPPGPGKVTVSIGLPQTRWNRERRK